MILECLHIGAHVQAIDREVHYLVDFLLVHNLRVSQVEQARAVVLSAFALAKAFQLQNHDLGHFVKLQLLGDVSVLLALVAVPLICTAESLLLLVSLEAAGQSHTRGRLVLLTCVLVVSTQVTVLALLVLQDNGKREVALVVHLVHDRLNRDLLGTKQSGAIDAANFQITFLCH